MNNAAHPRRSVSRLPVGHIPVEGAADIAELPAGAHLLTPRRRYVHHGIYSGSGTVVHYAGLCHSLRPLPVQEVALESFACGQMLAYLPRQSAVFDGPAAVARARSRIGEDAYDLLRNNCEHFCTWCLDGEARSEQVQQLLALNSGLFERVLARAGMKLAAGDYRESAATSRAVPSL